MKTLILIFSAATLIVLGALGVLVYQSAATPRQIQVTNSAQIAPVNSPVVTPISQESTVGYKPRTPMPTPRSNPVTTFITPDEWKTYKNSVHGFSFNYPNTAIVKEITSDYVLLTSNTNEGDADLVVLFFSSPNPDGLSRRNFFAKQGNTNISDVAQFLNISEVSLGEVDALRIVQDAEHYKQQSMPKTSYLVARGTTIFTIVTTEYDGVYVGGSTKLKSNQGDSTLIKHILSTFRI